MATFLKTSTLMILSMTAMSACGLDPFDPVGSIDLSMAEELSVNAKNRSDFPMEVYLAINEGSFENECGSGGEARFIVAPTEERSETVKLKCRKSRVDNSKEINFKLLCGKEECPHGTATKNANVVCTNEKCEI